MFTLYKDTLYSILGGLTKCFGLCHFATPSKGRASGWVEKFL